jgi:hypothetical protein
MKGAGLAGPLAEPFQQLSMDRTIFAATAVRDYGPGASRAWRGVIHRQTKLHFPYDVIGSLDQPLALRVAA